MPAEEDWSGPLKEMRMAIFRDDPVARLTKDKQRSPTAWVFGIACIAALLAAIFFYDGRDAKTVPGPNTPNVVDNPTGSK
jgi:hypothetical protein